MAAALRILGLGAILSAVSEVWFYPVTFGPELLELAIYYGILGYLAWLVLAQFGTQGVAAGYLGACLFGFLIEGVPVPVLFTALPFTIVWTSLAWHAILSVAVGLWAFRRVMARHGLAVQAAFCGAFGAYLGLSTVELWTIPQDGAPWGWVDIMNVWQQFVTGWAIFAAGHLLLNASARASVSPGRWELWGWSFIVTLAFVVQSGVLWFPFSLVLLVLVALVVWPLWRARRGGPAPVLVRLIQSTVPISGIVVSMLIPVAATFAHWGLMLGDIRLEASAFHILWAGPVSLGLLIWAIYRTLRPSAAA